MEMGPIEGTPEVLTPDPVALALGRIEESQDKLLQSNLFWKELPVEKRAKSIRTNMNAAHIVLQNGLETIFERGDNLDDNLAAAATVIGDIEKNRIKLFGDIFPEVRWMKTYKESSDIIGDDMDEYFEDVDKPLDQNDYINYFLDCYSGSLITDMNIFSQEVSVTSKAKFINSRGDVYKHTFEVAKAAAGIAIGGIIAGAVIKRNQK